jgi:hypothetical protein
MIILRGAFGLGMLAAGFFTVVFYHRRCPFARLSPGVGARLGAVSGAVGFVLVAIPAAIVTLLFQSGGESRSLVMQSFEQFAAGSSDPRAQQILEYLKTPRDFMLLMSVGLIVTLFAFLILSGLGGALGSALLRHRQRM